jgi:endonuclease/exonuclease/phosphatase family metal-dependent hydrolase
VPSRIRRAALAALAVVAAVALMAPVADAKPRKKQAKASTVTVMSRNIYLGGNIFGPLAGTTPEQFRQLAGVLWGEVQKTDFPTRAKLLAKEIKRTKPDLIGLQEVATWRRSVGAGDGQATPSTQVVYDFLKILRGELKKAGLQYRVGNSQSEADIEAQIDQGFDVRLTMHDVILVKQRKGLKVTKKLGRNYETKLSVPTQGGTLTSQRGWTAVDGKLDGKPFRFVNTHLEAALDATRDAQATELVGPNGPLRTSKQLFVTGDMNSDPQGRESTASGVDILKGAGLVDAWTLLKGRDPGYSCCLENPDLSDTSAGSFDHRIDFVFVKPKLKALKGWVLGKTLGERAANGLWPSDHAGVAVKLQYKKK